MKRKFALAILLLVIIAGILIPVVYANKVSRWQQAPESLAGGETGDDTPGFCQPYPPPGTIEKELGGGASAATDKTPAEDGPAAQNNASGTGIPERTAPGARDPGGAPPAAKEKEERALSIAVVGMNGEMLYGPGNITVAKKNGGEVTALDALAATGLPCTLSARWPGFVEAVAGQRNKGQGGWMYKVNGEIPMVAAGKKTVNEGDRVIWWYSRSMGSAPPEWEELIKRR
ncbi:MAG: DUF4430 domain-containing protein [Peptococcaceae bacterium]|nr:MAG: DUF4430 domain-containing protein [Peptococcaceae bacterium]